MNLEAGIFYSWRSPFKTQILLKIPFLAFWPLGSVLLPLQKKPVFSHSSPSLLYGLQRARRKRMREDCSYSINPSKRTSSSSVTFRLLKDTQWPALLSYRVFPDLSWSVAPKEVQVSQVPETKVFLTKKTTVINFHCKSHLKYLPVMLVDNRVWFYRLYWTMHPWRLKENKI